MQIKLCYKNVINNVDTDLVIGMIKWTKEAQAKNLLLQDKINAHDKEQIT